MGHIWGHIMVWNVVNDAMTTDWTLADTIFLRKLTWGLPVLNSFSDGHMNAIRGVPCCTMITKSKGLVPTSQRPCFYQLLEYPVNAFELSFDVFCYRCDHFG